MSFCGANMFLRNISTAQIEWSADSHHHALGVSYPFIFANHSLSYACVCDIAVLFPWMNETVLETFTGWKSHVLIGILRTWKNSRNYSTLPGITSTCSWKPRGILLMPLMVNVFNGRSFMRKQERIKDEKTGCLSISMSEAKGGIHGSIAWEKEDKKTRVTAEGSTRFEMVAGHFDFMLSCYPVSVADSEWMAFSFFSSKQCTRTWTSSIEQKKKKKERENSKRTSRWRVTSHEQTFLFLKVWHDNKERKRERGRAKLFLNTLSFFRWQQQGHTSLVTLLWQAGNWE